LLEYIIGSASISKGLSLYIDSLVNDTMKNAFKEIAPVNLGSFLSSYFDFFAFSGPLLLGLALSFGLRKSAGLNNILCILNLGVVFYVFIAVMLNANLDNWKIDPSTVPEQYRNQTGAGGFFPFGFSGTIKGAATCFFGFVGFDCIATTGEEVKNPRKAVPRAILFSLLIIFLAYFGVALLTLMWPYYLLVGRINSNLIKFLFIMNFF
jgi:amino acid transporter